MTTTIFAVLDANDVPVAYYTEAVHGTRLRPVYGEAPAPTEVDPHPMPPVTGAEVNPACVIPPNAIEITGEVWQECLAFPGHRRIIDGAAVAYVAPVSAAEMSARLSAYTMTRRDALIDGVFTFADVVYQSRPTDRENILGAVMLATTAISSGATAGDLRWNDPDADFEWIAADNTLVKMDAHTVIAFGRALAARKQELIFAALTVKGQIAAGAIITTAQIDAAFT